MLYEVITVHCGACSLTRREMLWRIERARAAGVPVTNYGMAISALQGVIERTLSPFPAALEAYREALEVKTAGGAAKGRITSYNVCYTKLLRMEEIRAKVGTDYNQAIWDHLVKALDKIRAGESHNFV